MDNIKTLATEWWRSKSSRGKTSLINKHGKGKEYKQGTYISVQDILEMYEAEHTSIRDGVEEFKEEWNKAMRAACIDKILTIEESRFILSTDTYEIPTYVLARVTGKSVEIILNKSIPDKVSFEEEVSNLQKYFNAKLIK